MLSKVIRPARAASMVRGVLSFAKTEVMDIKSPLRPGLLLRGYHSDRRLVYPPGFERDPHYITDLRYASAARSLNPADVRKDMESKDVFHAKMIRSGFGDLIPSTFGVFESGNYRTIEEYCGGPIFSKPVNGSGAKNINRWDNLDEALGSLPRVGTFLVQECLRPHPLIENIFSDSLNVLRILTVRPTAGEGVRVVAAIQRFATSLNAPKDTFGDGGLMANVDLQSGIMGEALAVSTHHRVVRSDHPDTASVIAGVKLPFFQEACQLVKDAADVWPTAQFIGWDVAVTKAGPVLIEGNASWPNLMMMQIAGPFIHDAQLVKWLKGVRLL